MTIARRFAGITPEVVENVRTGERVEGWLALSHTLPATGTRRGWSPPVIEGRQKVTVARRFAGITPEVVENVRTGEIIERWLALSRAPGGLNAARLVAIDNRGKAEGEGS